MKMSIIGGIGGIGGIFFLYLLGAFYNISFDISMWSMVSRELTSIMAFIIFIYTSIILLMLQEK